jgi:hypothetical protein
MDKILSTWVALNLFFAVICILAMLCAYGPINPDWEWTNFWLGGFIMSMVNMIICGCVAMSHYE